MVMPAGSFPSVYRLKCAASAGAVSLPFDAKTSPSAVAIVNESREYAAARIRRLSCRLSLFSRRSMIATGSSFCTDRDGNAGEGTGTTGGSSPIFSFPASCAPASRPFRARKKRKTATAMSRPMMMNRTVLSIPETTCAMACSPAFSFV